MRIDLICTWTFRTERRQSANNGSYRKNLCREAPLLDSFAFSWTAPLTAPVLRWTANAPCAVPSWRLHRPSGFPKNIDSPHQFCKLHLFLLVSGMSSKRNTRVTQKVRTNLPDSLKHNCRFGA